jgi:hypothetical protein
MKAGEIIRSIVLSLFAIGFILFVQPLFYKNSWLGLIIEDVPVARWLDNHYAKGSWIVLGVGIATMLLWYVITSFFATGKPEEFIKWRLIWFLLLLLPIGGIGIALFLNSISLNGQLGSKDAQVSLALFYIFDTLWLYWLTTVTSSPTPVKYVPPIAYPIRHDILKD